LVAVVLSGTLANVFELRMLMALTSINESSDLPERLFGSKICSPPLGTRSHFVTHE
jgi:hypothetical protein